MSKNNVIVTGGAGFIGSSFVRQITEQGYRAVVLDKFTYAGHRENIEECISSGDCEVVEGDICDFDSVKKLIARTRPVGIFNFAAESHVDNSIHGPKTFIETNIMGTFTLLEGVRTMWSEFNDSEKSKFRFLHVSTDEVYGQLGETGYFSETTAYHPSSPYSSSKAAADHLVTAWGHTYGLPTLITNCSNNYGPRQFPEKLIPVVIMSALAGRAIPVYGAGTNIRDWIHVEDHCRGIYLAFSKGKVGESYCFGGRSERKNIDVVNGICTILDQLHPRQDKQSYATQIQFVKDRPGHDFRYAIDDSKAERELGYKHKYASFEEGLHSTVKWYLDNFNWTQAVINKKGASSKAAALASEARYGFTKT